MQTKTILFCSGYRYRPHYNAENDQRKRIDPKTLYKVERFENGTVWKRCFPSVRGGENDAIWKRWCHQAAGSLNRNIQDGRKTPWTGFFVDRDDF